MTAPIFTRPRYLPCSRISGATVNNSLISDGCVIGKGSLIENSVKYAVATSKRAVTISVEAREEAGQLVLCVADDGPGVARRRQAAGSG